MSAQVIAILRQALPPADSQRTAQQTAIERLAEIRRRSHLPAHAAPAEQLVREDRDLTR